jgi:hypothetical protein
MLGTTRDVYARETLRFNFSYYGHQAVYSIASAGNVIIGPQGTAEIFEEQFAGAINKSCGECRSRILDAKFVNNANI